MADEIWKHVSEWLTPVLAWVGGIVGIIRILEFLRDRPKLIGEVRAAGINSDLRERDKKPANAVVTLYVHIVNKRIRPATIKDWQLTVYVNSKKHECIQREIHQSNLPEEISVEDLDDLTRKNALDYGKGVTGMLEFMIPDVSRRTLIEGCKLIITATDSLGGKHKIKHQIRKEPD